MTPTASLSSFGWLLTKILAAFAQCIHLTRDLPHVFFTLRRGPPLRSHEVHVRFPDIVPVLELPLNVLRDLLRSGRPLLRDVRATLPGPSFQLLQEGRLLHALPHENRVPQDVLLPV